ncbi:class I SAM-dependent methyltransferase [Sphingomonas sp. 28-62-20]|uniref:class I SAM-dependent methyltransferase n=1 Tax=Sphingomonas sp. 28-62-20 TaxID=1970433 RepID=UPI0026AA1DB5
MTARWYENVKATHGDVDAYIRTRHLAYMDRWREAGRFIADNSTVLDIGGGNLFPELLTYFKSRGLKYSYLDVDPAAVDSSRAMADQVGLANASFALGFNDQLDFPEGSFDAVFSSHCIEHSIDLSATFRELNRVLKAGGNLERFSIMLHRIRMGRNNWRIPVVSRG